jgi:hypothetical protein
MTARINKTDFAAPEIVNTLHQRALGVGLLFGVASLIAAILPATRQQFYHSYLIGFMLWLGASLGSMAFLMIQHLTGGMWGMLIRRQLEAAMKVLPLMAVLFIPVIVGMPYLYTGTPGLNDGWMKPYPTDTHLIQMTHSYLTVHGYIERAIACFAIWLLLAFILSRWSDEQDSPPVQNLSPRFRKIAAPGLILYAFTISFAVIDWVMSLDPHWISTIYGFIFIVGECLTAMCLMVIVESILSRYQPTASLLKAKEVHDHGKLMLTFVMLFAYFSFSQLLIIWAGNLPSEITFFTRRLNEGWQRVGLALVLFHFAVPFLFLLSRSFKRNPRQLIWLAGWLIFMRLVDLFWYIEPNFHRSFYFSPLDLVVPIAIGGFWLAYFFRNLRSRPLLPVYDQHAQEFLEYAEAAHE